MIIRDIHSNKETVETALYDMDQTIFLAKKRREHIICLIIGYGSKGKTHKIHTAVLDTLAEFEPLVTKSNKILAS